LALVASASLDIVVTKHSIEIDPVLKQLRKGPFEVLDEVTSFTVWVDIVPGSNHKIQGCARVVVEHLAGYSHLVMIAGSPVTEHCKPNRAFGRFGGKKRSGLY
jgi:hypothetical protein